MRKKDETLVTVAEISNAVGLMAWARWANQIEYAVAKDGRIIVDSLREEFGVTYDEIAAVTGISTPWLCRLRNGHKGCKMNLDIAARLCNAWHHFDGLRSNTDEQL